MTVFPQIARRGNLIHVEGNPAPLISKIPKEDKAQGDVLVSGCEFCEWTCVDLQRWATGQSGYCPECYSQPEIALKRYTDQDGDGWVDGIKKVRAKWSGGRRPIGLVDTLVVHRYSKGRGKAGPRYIANPHGRHVSWHATVHYEGFKRGSTLHLPVDQIGWHAGSRSHNRRSIGVEFDAAESGDVDAPYDNGSIKELVRLAYAWKEMCPNLRFCTGHSDIVPGRRRDPGKNFPWGALEAIGLKRT